jgi:hypothetical protein
MLQRSAPRNTLLRLQLAYGAAKNPQELWKNATWREFDVSCRIRFEFVWQYIMQFASKPRNHDRSQIAEEDSTAY